jgi:uncharacterized protein YndB with AHSA1/START domain
MQVFFRWLLIAALAVVLILAIAFAAGAVLPARIDVTRSVVINRPPENIWRVLTDYNSLSLWHPQYRGTRIISNPGEKPVRWRALYTDGRTANVTVAEENFPLRYAEKISDIDLPFSGRWQLQMERSDLTTKVTAHSFHGRTAPPARPALCAPVREARSGAGPDPGGIEAQSGKRYREPGAGHELKVRKPGTDGSVHAAPNTGGLGTDTSVPGFLTC